MEDIFKIIFYAVAILLWILYKAREQKKSGMWTPRTEVKPVINQPAPDQSQTPVHKATKPVSPPKVVRTTDPTFQKVRKEIQFPEPLMTTETWNSPFYNQIIKEDVAAQQLLLTELETKDGVIPDIRQAIIWTEILKRPGW